MKIKTLSLSGFKFSFRNLREFLSIYKDVFLLGDYRPKMANNEPTILDCGSHIGISVLYFKKMFPLSKIIAFEPNPENFGLLKLNLKQNGFEDINVVNAAVSDKTGEINSYVTKDIKNPWTWGDSAVKNLWYDPKKYHSVKVGAVRLSSYVNKEIDFIKLDIEGLEEKVLREISKKLDMVREIILEFHGSSTNESNKLENVLKILQKGRFKITIKQEGKEVSLDRIKKKDPYWLLIHATKS